MNRFVTTLSKMFRPLPSSSKRTSVFSVGLLLLSCGACTQASTGHMLDETASPGANYDKADRAEITAKVATAEEGARDEVCGSYRLSFWPTARKPTA